MFQFQWIGVFVLSFSVEVLLYSRYIIIIEVLWNIGDLLYKVIKERRHDLWSVRGYSENRKIEVNLWDMKGIVEFWEDRWNFMEFFIKKFSL